MACSKEERLRTRQPTMGTVRKVGNAWKAEIKLDKATMETLGCTCRTRQGPRRDTEAAAQADLDTARRCTSRSGMCRVLASLVSIAKEERSAIAKLGSLQTKVG